MALSKITNDGIDNITVDSSGNVGIGTTSPNNQLEIKSDTATVVARLACNTGSGRDWGLASATDGIFGIYDYDAASYRMIIDSSGNVKIGDATTDVISKLTVSGNGSADTAAFMYDGSAGTYFDINTNAANGSVDLEANARSGAFPPLTFITGGSESMRINSSGGMIVGTTAPPSGAGGVVQFFLKQTSSSNGIASIANGNDAYIRITHDGSVGRLSTTYGTSAGYTPLVFDTGGAERLRIDTSGNVGIGTSSPSYKLSILENANNFLQFSQAGDGVAGSLIGRSSSTNLRIQNSENADTEFWTNNIERMRITGNGDVGIGTTSPATYGQLAVYKSSGDIEAAVVTGGANYATYRVQNSAQRYSMQIRTDQSNAFVIRDETASANRFVVDTAGKVGIGTAPSAGVQLDVRGTGVLQLVNTDTVQLLASNGGSTLKNVSNNPLLFGTNNTERMRIESSGNLLVGTTSTTGSSNNTAGKLVVPGGMRSFSGQTASIANGATVDITLANPQRSLYAYYINSDGNSNHAAAGFFWSNYNGASSNMNLFSGTSVLVGVSSPSGGIIRITNSTGVTISFSYSFTILSTPLA